MVEIRLDGGWMDLFNSWQKVNYTPTDYERKQIMEFLLELFFEIVVDGIFELIVHCYIKLMHLIVPDKTFSEKTIKTIKNIVTAFAAILAFVLIIGFFLLLQGDPFIKTIGKYMTYIPLAIIVLQILIGIIVKIVTRCKK